ncbi:MAG: ribonuclease E activity regulator RraA [Gammaproteobacteria bacterium]|nr:ribonuclease E activity regulator RraA [Gammaproteobacteria bacterium]
MDAAFATADLYDAHADSVQVAEPVFRDFGGQRRFAGPVATCKVFEDNSLVRGMLEEPGEGRVLVVDGGGSLRCALVGDQLAALGVRNGWAGIVVWGCVRDCAALGIQDIGIKALATNPRKSVKRGEGSRDLEVSFAGIRCAPGAWLYADEDGVLVAATAL